MEYAPPPSEDRSAAEDSSKQIEAMTLNPNQSEDRSAAEYSSKQIEAMTLRRNQILEHRYITVSEDSFDQIEVMTIKRNQLLKHRRDLEDLFQSWESAKWSEYEEKEIIFHPYLHLLYTAPDIHQGRSDIEIDLGIVERLHKLLERGIHEGKINYINFKTAFLSAHHKKGLVLRDLDRMSKFGVPDYEFQEWIEQELKNCKWEACLDFVYGSVAVVLEIANSIGMSLEEKNITPEITKVKSLDDAQKCLVAYDKEIKDAQNMTQKNVDFVGHGSVMCELIDQITPKLRSRMEPKGSEVEGQGVDLTTTQAA